MAKPIRKPVKNTPITSHRLFPAVVALWFGALFGLGSLAVRPTLLEGLVHKSQIDLFISAAAPPLGVTARILIALVLAGLGAIIGIALARRLARAQITEYEPDHGATDLSAGALQIRSRDAHPDAPARAPISAHAELGSAAEASSQSLARHRAMAIVHEDNAFGQGDSGKLVGATAQIPQTAEIGGKADQVPAPAAFDFAPSAQPAPPLPSLTSAAAPLPSPSGLGMADLAIRLNDAMRRRRGIRAAANLPESTEAAIENSYGSLLGLSPPFAGFVGVTHPAGELVATEPVVIFPGQAQPSTNALPPVDPAEAERALRAALSNLQRMSGAA